MGQLDQAARPPLALSPAAGSSAESKQRSCNRKSEKVRDYAAIGVNAGLCLPLEGKPDSNQGSCFLTKKIVPDFRNCAGFFTNCDF